MSEPIKVGDICEVVEGALGLKGPNVGKIVTVRALRGEHSKYGRIWQCEGSGLITEYGAVGNSMDFASSWLKKIPPEKEQDKSLKKALLV